MLLGQVDYPLVPIPEGRQVQQLGSERRDDYLSHPTYLNRTGNKLFPIAH
ncbi:hypothetical protein RBB68_10195 [Leptospira interrogans]|nr:hypothetical protein [Leptospira interrogans]WML95878.1 hypothetical protein RBB68_10195 [Leptospira interrogans]